MMRGSKTNPHVDPQTFINHLNELYNPSQEDAPFPEVHTCERDPSILTAKITTEEVSETLKSLNSKSVANMGISPRMLKDAEPALSPLMTSIYNHIMETSHFPEECMVVHTKKRFSWYS